MAGDCEPVLKMRATVADFEAVVADRTIASVIVRGFGNLSALATPMRPDEGAPVVLLDWLHLSAMTLHLKLGSFTMRTCGVTPRMFNPPFPYGVMSSHRSISAAVGSVISVVGLKDPANRLIKPITESDELSYDEIKEQFPLQRRRKVPSSVLDVVYYGARAVHNMIVSDTAIRAAKPQQL